MKEEVNEMTNVNFDLIRGWISEHLKMPNDIVHSHGRNVIVNTEIGLKEITIPKLTEENKKAIFKGIAIATAILAVVMAVVHVGIKNVVISAITDGTELEWSDVKEAVKDSEEFLKDNDLGMAQKELEELVDMVKVFYGRVNLYGMDWLVFVVMIGVEYVLVVKKEQEA